MSKTRHNIASSKDRAFARTHYPRHHLHHKGDKTASKAGPTGSSRHFFLPFLKWALISATVMAIPVALGYFATLAIIGVIGAWATGTIAGAVLGASTEMMLNRFNSKKKVDPTPSDKGTSSSKGSTISIAKDLKEFKLGQDPIVSSEDDKPITPMGKINVGSFTLPEEPEETESQETESSCDLGI